MPISTGARVFNKQAELRLFGNNIQAYSELLREQQSRFCRVSNPRCYRLEESYRAVNRALMFGPTYSIMFLHLSHSRAGHSAAVRAVGNTGTKGSGLRAWPFFFWKSYLLTCGSHIETSKCYNTTSTGVEESENING